MDRYSFYDRTKHITAAPPEVLRVDEKNAHEYVIPNLCGVVITTNHKTDGLYLPTGDRRHYVAWSPRTKEDYPADYWDTLHQWYSTGGNEHVAAYLAAVDLTDFSANAPPPKTEAFYDIVAANRVPEEADLADALDTLGYPEAITLAIVMGHVSADFAAWLKDHRNSRKVPHRFEAVGYVPVRNTDATDGLWVVAKRRAVIHARKTLTWLTASLPPPR